jgi:flagellar biosynthesis GTPase FlhF
MFLQTLDELKEEKEQGKLRAAALQREKDAELERQLREAERQRAEEEAAAAARSQKGHARDHSEVDYGIEKTTPNGSIKGRGKGEKQSGNNRTAFSPTGSKNIKRPEKPVSRPEQTRTLANVLRNILRYISKTIAGNPLSFARTLLFLLGLLVALGRQDMRERLRRITDAAWQKVKGTVGMGVKVSYI